MFSRSLSGSRNFSSCSADDFEKLILNAGGTCLLNVPRPDEAYSAPYCGNKLVDVGEECDCGSVEVRVLASGVSSGVHSLMHRVQWSGQEE